MPNYCRSYLPGGTYFFTLVTNLRRSIFLEAKARQVLRESFHRGMEKIGPFKVEAICLLPDHLHCIWTLPDNDDNYSARWKVIKAYFSHQYLQLGGTAGKTTSSKANKGELGVWQRRFWEHSIGNLVDLNRHIDYIHYNPVKHGLVQAVKAWPWSSFHRYVQEGYYDPEWGNENSGLDEIVVGE